MPPNSVVFQKSICLITASTILMAPAPAQTQTKDEASQATPQSQTLQRVESPREPGNFHEGTSFKIGPVTDDAKLIKPVAGEDNGSVTTRSNPAPEKKRSEEEAGMRDERITNKEYSFGDQGKISIGALNLAKDLEILPLIEDLVNWRRSHGNSKDASDMYSLSLRQELDEDLFSAFLQSRRVTSELDRQIAGYDAVARVLEDKRDQAIRTNNIINFTSGGALAVTQGAISIGTPMKFQNTGNELGAIAGGLTALIGAYAIKIQKGGKRTAEREPNMLAPVFDLEPVEPNKYPPITWNYLNTYEPGQKNTRREQLIQRWQTLKYIDKCCEKNGMEKLEALSGTVPLKQKVTIDLLRTRIPMLQDLRAAVAGMNEYLDEILTFVRGPERIAVKYHVTGKITGILQGSPDKEKKN